MQAQRRITEITGKPGKVWGSVFIPSSGSITVKIAGDMLQSTLKSGVEKTDSWVRIQNIDTIEVVESPEYLLLALGIFLILFGLPFLGGNAFLLGLIFLAAGIACSVYAFIKKRRLLVIYSLRYIIPIFMTKSPAGYQQFAEQIMVLARHLNAPPAPHQASRPTNGKSPTQQTTGSRTALQ